MKKTSFKALPNFSQPKKVDRENGILKGVEIAKYGRNKNQSFFDDKFLTDLVDKGNDQNQGVKSRFGHPNMCASSLGTYVGRYKNFRVKERKVYADLYLDPISKKKQVEGGGISMFDYIMDMAESNSDMFGNSIVIMGDEYENEIENENGEKKWETVKVLHSLIASDLVDDPAATDALFSNEDDFGVAMTEFLDDNPQIFDIVANKPDVVSDFFDRYEAYQKRKSINTNMDLLKRMKQKFGKNKEEDESFDVDLTLATGDVVTVVTDNETPQVGDEVRDQDGNTVPDDNHVLNDGSTIVTESGRITEILPADDGGEGEEGEEEENSTKALEQKFDTFAEDVSKSLEFLTDKFKEQDTRLNKFGKQITSKQFETPKGEQNKNPKSGQSLFEKMQAELDANKKQD